MAEGAQYGKDFSDKIEREAYVNHRSLRDEELDRRFGFRNLPPEEINDITKLREKFRDLAWYIDNYVPTTPESARAKAIALTELEGASHWAVKALTYGIKEDIDAAT